MKKVLAIILKTVATVLLCAVLVIDLTEFSPIYDFESPRPFSGPDIFNPYGSLDTAQCWKRANFHTHTRVASPLNECEYWPDEVLRRYSSLGYDIVTFSNHNAITAHPGDSALQVNVYEHGYNLFKYHLLVFGSDRVVHFDPLLPVLSSQRQWVLDYLSRSCDFIQLNHPFRTNLTSKDDLECLSGYSLIELDSGITTEQEYWDWALSAGHYSFALANDDLHYPDASGCIARRCNMLCCRDGSYSELSSALMTGRFYSMRVPDYGKGDWDVKREANSHLPQIDNIGACGDSLFVELSARASEIRVTGQDGAALASVSDSAALGYLMRPEDSYARFTAYFEDGVVIYSNVFARYDSSLSDSPRRVATHKLNPVLTILYNLLILSIAVGCVLAIRALFRRRRQS